MQNKRKLFIYNCTIGRYYRPLIGIYFLTLPSSTANQIGFFITVAHITKFIFEIPSWYLGDRFGHKNTLVLAQVFMFLAVIFFGIATNIWFFVVGAFLMAIGQSLSSGTNEAFFHEMLEKNWQEKKFGTERGRFRGNVALVSMIFLIIYPRIAELHITRPFRINAGLNIIGIISTLSLSPPTHIHHIHTSNTTQSIRHIIKRQKHTGFYLIALLFAIIGGIYISESSFREPFIVAIWLPIGFIGIMIGLSRFMMRGLSKTSLLSKLEPMPLKTFMLLDMSLMSIGYVLAGSVGQPYITMLIFTFIIGYWQSRRWIISKHLFHTLQNKKYKATALSIYSQIESLLWAIIVIGMWYMMHRSYSKWFLLTGIWLFIILTLFYQFFIKKNNIINKKV